MVHVVDNVETAQDPTTPAPKGFLEGKIEFPDCGPTITKECFFDRYKSSGLLDFLSFLGYAPALIGCATFDEYEYGFCFSNFAYVIVDAYTKKAAPPNTDHW